ncbi:MAG: hypothetical protein JWM57_1070 [Phycisphaerales bacterium]|nr:hypothetical protein [Phycisphaerales bacterium]
MRNRLLTLLTLTTLAGCQMNQKPDDLSLGQAALSQRNYPEAQSRFDAYLKNDANGPRAAEAYYLKGHALQDARFEDQADAQSHLQQARLAYIDALKAGTDDRALEGLIRASLADVAFWQEDYQVAAEQGAAAYGLLEDPNVRAMSLYRAGLSQQRLGQFEKGDKTLALVVQYHPGTQQALRAKQRIGIRAFNVKIPFTSTAAATGAVAALTRQGFAPAPPVAGDPSINIGPFTTYAQANAARTRLNTQYPKAVIVP